MTSESRASCPISSLHFPYPQSSIHLNSIKQIPVPRPRVLVHNTCSPATTIVPAINYTPTLSSSHCAPSTRRTPPWNDTCPSLGHATSPSPPALSSAGSSGRSPWRRGGREGCRGWLGPGFAGWSSLIGGLKLVLGWFAAGCHVRGRCVWGPFGLGGVCSLFAELKTGEIGCSWRYPIKLSRPRYCNSILFGDQWIAYYLLHSFLTIMILWS